MSKKKLSKGAADTEQPSFEECLGELESIVGELESGKLGLADALARFEQGVKHLNSCHGLLERAERRIELLTGIDAEGNPITQTFDADEDATLEEKAASRSRRRSREGNSPIDKRRPPDGEIDEPRRLF